ncbi:unnamed protein product [Penicillium salamii]|nr:unnamed protein product [Penicillium salamii]CAG8303234.1 unnamed protein product [Penicillium salamii]
MSASGKKSGGCFQCSKRRIICDGTQPICTKCQKRGIECSGPGRIRFLNAVAMRGRLKGCTVPVSGNSDSGIVAQPQQPAAIQPRQIRWKDDQKVRSKRKYTKRRANLIESDLETTAGTHSRMPRGQESRHNDQQESISVSSTSQRQIVNRSRTAKHSLPPHDHAFSGTLRNKTPGVTSGRVASSTTHGIVPWLAPLSADTRMLFFHFAEQVAPVMVILDGISNGYRDVLLPLACEDNLLQHAICVVATQHLTLHNTSHKNDADQNRAAVISRLRRDSLQSSPNRIFNVSTWATLIVLLVGETITGGSECGHLLQTLISLAGNICQKTSSRLTQFLLQQTHMFHLLGQPLLGTSGGGASPLTLPIGHYLDWTYYDIPSHSEHHDLLQISRMAFVKAFQIYTGRKTSNDHQWELLESLKTLVCQIDPNQTGSHALVWVCFIGAADSVDPIHRRFFVDRMSQIYAKTQFQNIAAGIRSLPRIWSEQSSGRWTEDLVRLAPTLVI